jgi:phenylalanyl-tRNA synthetase beta chain
MKISYSWLKQYININLPADEVANLLTGCGLEVESIEKFETVKGGLKGVVIGEVIEKEKHPNADRLTVTKVNVGNGEPLQIVCGAPNVEIGQKVAVALVESTLYPTSGEPFQIKKSKIRGELSEGMICAEDEIGLGISHEGIMVLNKDAHVGTSAADYFKVEEDSIFEIGLTPNRSDAASHIGVARDLAAVLNVNQPSSPVLLSFPSVDDFRVDSNESPIEVIVENKKDCIRYSGISLSGISINESPAWLKNKLKAIGLKPINNIVDITNYVLFETGQPLHAFDADEISGNKVIVKNLPSKSKFITLDNVERELNGEELMICNSNEGMCIAGIFGGAKSGVSELTKNIFLESACFNPVSIRKSSKYHGLKTDASFRFERGTDPDITIYVLKRAALLIREICGGKISSYIVDIYPEPVKNAIVNFSYKSAARLMGMSLEKSLIKNILKQLEIKVVTETEDGLKLLIPNFKVDVKREPDVVEEIMRIYGYNHVPLPSKMNMPLPTHIEESNENLFNNLSGFLVVNGFHEMLSNPLTKEGYAVQLNKKEEAVKIHNPLSNDLGIMRQSFLFSGLEAIQYNRNRKRTNLRLFEFGKTYHKSGKGYKEINHLSLFVTGARYEEGRFKQEPLSYNIFYIKSLLNNLFSQAGIQQKNRFHRGSKNELLTTSVEVIVNKTKLAEYGIVNPDLQKSFDIDDDVYYADIFTDELIDIASNSKHSVVEPPKFPEVRRDISMIINKSVSYAEIEVLAFETEKSILKHINLFDVYEGKNMEPGKISYAVSFVLQDDEKTLQDKQIDTVMKRLMQAFEAKLGAQIRM